MPRRHSFGVSESVSAQPSLLDLCFSGPPAEVRALTGSQLRDLGIDSALDRAQRIKADYVASCLRAIASFPKGSSLTSEDVREKAGPIPLELNHSVMAGILKHAASKGLIRITGETRVATRASVHAKRLSLWVRL